jgi:hypothetical protein
MADASKKHFGPGSQGKRDGSGAETDVPVEKIGENMFCRTATRRCIRSSAARTASRCKPSSCRTTPATASATTNRHCERGEAIQGNTCGPWIASARRASQ